MSVKGATIKHVVFDAAETLIHKPDLLIRFNGALKDKGIEIAPSLLASRHKIVSESVQFPDQTSKAFYQDFNARVLAALGVVPNEELVDSIFNACTYLPWAPFADTQVLSEIDVPISVISNFNSDLPKLLNGFFGDIFQHIFVSEMLGVAKPGVAFYERALEGLDCDPATVFYIGDSVRLDMAPALKVGMQACLIDRNDLFGSYNPRISRLTDLTKYLAEG
jgi:putative hydrolase of the HAD superfamily